MVEIDPSQVNKEILLKRKTQFEKLMTSKYYYSLGSEIYGGVAGLYDWGPPGQAIRKNIQNLWRDHFVLEEDMLEISTTCITPEKVFQASGHVKKFTDLLVRDVVTKQGYRADKYLVEWIEKKLAKEQKKLNEDEKKKLNKIMQDSEQYSQQQLTEVYQELKIKAPDTNNNLTDPEPFNLMFPTQIGPSGASLGYLRPETAQGMFVNYKQLQTYVNGKLPFGAAQIGLGFRNEIAPRGQLLRVREFDLAEIEYFFDPLDTTHPKYQDVCELTVPLVSAANQEKGDFTSYHTKLKDAVDNNVISNQTMAYFLYRTYLFLIYAGVNQQNIRFRQHRKTEMAHYACDCWDAEVETSNGWVEMVGHANRSAYDLECHSKASQKPLVAARVLKEPKTITVVEMELNKQILGKTFKQKQKIIMDYLENLPDNEKIDLWKFLQENNTKQVNIDGEDFNLEKTFFKKMDEVQKNVTEEKYTPWVIEPAFGLGRIISAVLEHNFKMRDEQRTYVKLPPKIAPYKCCILPVQSTEESKKVIQELRKSLIKSSISLKIDETNATIGRRYTRCDELGIPFGITVDNDTFTDKSVTLREIDTMKQVRVKISEITDLLYQLSEGFKTWDDVLKEYPLFELKSNE